VALADRGPPHAVTAARRQSADLLTPGNRSGGQLLSPLLDLEKRVHGRRAAADQADASLAAHPLWPKLVGVLDVIRVAALHLRQIHELARVRRVLPADDDDCVHLLGELARGGLTLHGDRTDGVEDLGLLRDLGDMRDQVLERPGWLRRLRDDAGLLHARELLPLFLRFDDGGFGREAEQANDLGMLGRAEDDHAVALVGQLLRKTLRPEHEGARRIDALEALRLDLRAHLRGYAVRADDDDAFLRFGRILDDFHAESAKPLADLRVVDDLTEVVHGAAGFGRGFGQLDGFLDPETEPVLACEKHFHDIKCRGRSAIHTPLLRRHERGDATHDRIGDRLRVVRLDREICGSERLADTNDDVATP